MRDPAGELAREGPEAKRCGPNWGSDRSACSRPKQTMRRSGREGPMGTGVEGEEEKAG